ncbi:transcriptional regulator GcvA [Azospirillum sp. TSO35-2]|uniref:transcriptional regulator GcvA n=1 Tax=Azospirillum sp. TSO35-2 TaxID=716796 RepID=UPI000D60B9B3|nr:transcriptional regulator GcvA [Azospirillum sp. TSO35-2]PWC34227.1 LysR family transcriptional regulator [Azospirillum sp. TSO35-2]
MRDPHSRLPPLNALRAFDVAARHLNFRLAAEEMGVTQGAVAQQVRNLEATLGVKMFERRPRSLALTDEGRSYVVQIRRAFALIADATAAVRPAPLRLTISVTPTFASKWLIPRLPDFTAAHPDVDLRVLAAESLSNFQSDGVDIAVRQGKPPVAPGLRVDPLFEQGVTAVCSPNLLAGARLPLAPDDLTRFTLLHDAHNLWPDYIEAEFPGAGLSAGRGIRFSHTSLAIDAAVAGQGIALVSGVLVEQELAAGRLVRPFRTTIAAPGFYVVMPRKPRHPAPTLAIRRWLLENGAGQGACSPE